MQKKKNQDASLMKFIEPPLPPPNPFINEEIPDLVGTELHDFDFFFDLAKFMDKNVSISCTEQLITCIRKFCCKIVDEGEENNKAEFKVPVNDIIDMVKEEFGFFLPYLILKRSKRIKKASFYCS